MKRIRREWNHGRSFGTWDSRRSSRSLGFASQAHPGATPDEEVLPGNAAHRATVDDMAEGRELGHLEAGESEKRVTENLEEVPEIASPPEDAVPGQVQEDEPGRWMWLLRADDGHPGDLEEEHVALVQGRVQSVQRFGYLLGTLQQDLDRLQDSPGAAARIAQLLLALARHQGKESTPGRKHWG